MTRRHAPCLALRAAPRRFDADERRRTAAPFLVALLALCGCSVGEGEGWVASDRLYMQDCWNGPFDLGPDFFAANPFREEHLIIRVQRGDAIEERSDGLTVLVNDVSELRQRLGEPVPIGLPVGVAPPGTPVMETDTPPKVSLTLYLHNSCHLQNAAIHSISGQIVFDALFSGDPSESRADLRLTEASFEAQMADPRQLAAGEPAEEVTSTVRGYFRFYYERGQPAQPFP